MSLTNNIACQTIISELLGEYKSLFNNIMACNEFTHKITKNIGLIISEEYALTNLTTITSSFASIELNIDECISDLGSINISTIDLSLFPVTPDQSTSSLISGNYYTGSYSILATEFIKSFETQIKESITTNLTSFESQATLCMFKLNNCINNSTYANVLEKINWVTTNSCTTTETLPTIALITQWLNKFGLDTNLNVDYTQQVFSMLSMSTSIKTFFTTLLDMQENIKTKLETLYITYL